MYLYVSYISSACISSSGGFNYVESSWAVTPDEMGCTGRCIHILKNS